MDDSTCHVVPLASRSYTVTFLGLWTMVHYKCMYIHYSSELYISQMSAADYVLKK